MPTELPARKVEPPKSTATGNLVTIATVLLMVVLSIAMIRQGQEDAGANDPVQTQILKHEA